LIKLLIHPQNSITGTVLVCSQGTYRCW
jgi:hypothetical protein